MGYVKTGGRRARAVTGDGQFGFDVPGSCPDGYSWSWGDCVPDAPAKAQAGAAAAAAAAVEQNALTYANGCKANSVWNGKACQCKDGFVLVGTDCVPAAAGGGCPPGTTKDPMGNCASVCGDNAYYYPPGDTCGCLPGYVQASPGSPDCVKAPGGGGGQPAVEKACPAGTSGTYPNCVATQPPAKPVPPAPPVQPAASNRAWVLAAVGGGALLLIAGAAALGGPKKKARSRGDAPPSGR